MSEYSEGRRVKVVKDLSGDGEYVGRFGTVHEGPKYFEGTAVVGVGVKLDNESGVLEFDPDELELVEPDPAADAADSARDMDRADDLLRGAR